MMRTSTGVAIAAGLVVLAGGTLVLGSASSASASPATSSAKLVKLTSKTQQFAIIDVGEKGPALGLGDEIVSSDRVYRHGKPAGRSGTVLTVVGVTSTALTTQWLTTIELPEGQLVLQGIGDGPTGPPTSPVTFSAAVTGGTGVYAKAHGTADILDHPGGTEDITIRLG